MRMPANHGKYPNGLMEGCVGTICFGSQSSHKAKQVSQAPVTRAAMQRAASAKPRCPCVLKTSRAANPKRNTSATINEALMSRLRRALPARAACVGASGWPRSLGSPLPPRKRVAMPGETAAGLSAAGSADEGGALAPFNKWPSPRPKAGLAGFDTNASALFGAYASLAKKKGARRRAASRNRRRRRKEALSSASVEK